MEPQLHECTAKAASVGYDEQNEDSSVHQWNGEDCVIAEGDVLYTYLEEGEDYNWLSLFFVPHGHGSTWAGNHKAELFDCVPIEDYEDPKQ